MSEELINIEKLEEQIFQFEEVRVIFRTIKNRLVKPYPYKTLVGDSKLLISLHERLEATYPELSFVIIDGYGLTPGVKAKKLKQVRQSYIR